MLYGQKLCSQEVRCDFDMESVSLSDSQVSEVGPQEGSGRAGKQKGVRVVGFSCAAEKS